MQIEKVGLSTSPIGDARTNLIVARGVLKIKEPCLTKLQEMRANVFESRSQKMKLIPACFH